MNDLRYPIGRFQPPAVYTSEVRAAMIDEIRQLPGQLKEAVAGLSESQLDTPYRDGGWTVRQVVHHLADSHLNAYVRFKLGLTEEAPRVKTYEEALWAEIPDGRHAPVEISLNLIDALHQRWVFFLRAMDDTAFARVIDHPEKGRVELNWILALYAWHCRHHVAHIRALRERMGW